MDLPIPQTALILALVFLGGFVDAIAGGGGLISLPAYLAAGLPPHAALATNKFSSCLGTMAAVIRYWRAGTLRWRLGLVAALGAVAGSVVGARLVLMIPAIVVHTLVLVLLPAALLLLLFRERLFPAKAGATPVRGILLRSALIGLAIGTYDGFFGPGTGTFMTLAFATFLALDLLGASANARLANLASNAGSLLVFLWYGEVLFPLAWLAATAGIGGNLLGSRLAIRKGDRVIRPLLVVVLFLLLLEILRRRFGG
jgi:uncharacterized membrane protein YfcA